MNYTNNINCHLMKPLERKFFKTCCRQINYNKVDDISNISFINPMCVIAENFSNKYGINIKMLERYLEKWERYGFYDYGIGVFFGWFKFDLLPEQYKEIIPKRVISKLHMGELKPTVMTKLLIPKYDGKDIKLHYFGYIEQETFDRDNAWKICNWASYRKERPKELHCNISFCPSLIVLVESDNNLYHVPMGNGSGWYSSFSEDNIIEHFKNSPLSMSLLREMYKYSK